MSYLFFDAVLLVQDVPEDGLVAGVIGVIVDIYTEPTEAYEVEFCDPDGRTLALLALLPEQIRPSKNS